MWSLGAIVIAAVTGPAPDGKAVRLVYVRDAGAEKCPAEAELRAAVTSRLGYDPFLAEAPRSVLARVGASEGGLVGGIELIDEAGLSRGKRELRTDGATCDEMARAMALSMSIAVDPERAARGETTPAPASSAALPPPPPEPEPAPTPPAAPPPAPKPALAPARAPLQDRLPHPETPRTHLSVSLAALSTAGIAPGFALGGALGVQGQRGVWAMGVGARLVHAPAALVDRATQLEVTLAAGELSGCLRDSVFEHCLLGLAGNTWLVPGGVAQPRPASGIFGALGARSGFSVKVSPRFGVFAHLEGLAVLSPIHAQVDGSDVWAGPSFAGSLAAGARTNFW
jgi:hypothetical protein